MASATSLGPNHLRVLYTIGISPLIGFSATLISLLFTLDVAARNEPVKIEVKACHFSAQNPPVVPLITQSENQSPESGLGGWTWYCSLLSLWMLPPQGLCTCLFLCWNTLPQTSKWLSPSLICLQNIVTFSVKPSLTILFKTSNHLIQDFRCNSPTGHFISSFPNFFFLLTMTILWFPHFIYFMRVEIFVFLVHDIFPAHRTVFGT